MSNVVKLQLKAGRFLTAEETLNAAIDRGPVEVVVVEASRNGDISLFASRGINNADVLWFLENAKLALLAGET